MVWLHPKIFTSITIGLVDVEFGPKSREAYKFQTHSASKRDCYLFLIKL